MNDFGVLIACYHGDNAIVLHEALGSIFNNTLLPDEVVLVVDGPVPHELEKVVFEFEKNSIFSAFYLEENKGLSHALNYGLSKMRSKYVIRCDSDDFNMRNRFEEQMSLLKDGFELVGSNVIERDSAGTAYAIKKVPSDHLEILSYARRRNPFNHMSVGFERSTVLQLGGYPTIPLKEDYALWAMILTTGKRTCNSERIWVKVSAGDRMFKRRSGFTVIKSEFFLQIFFYKIGFKPAVECLWHFMSRALLLSLPPTVKRYIYMKFFRATF